MRKGKAARRGCLFLVSTGSRSSRQLCILGLLLFYCVLFYYFGELVDFFGWKALRWSIFYGIHDLHRLFFLAPILYSAYVFGVRATLIITIISAMTFIPRALFISSFPDPILRMTIFALIAGVMGYLVAVVRRESEKRIRLETLLMNERDTLPGTLERMTDGVFIVGPDYRVRFMNQSMEKNFTEGRGSPCYKWLHGLNEPCRDICKLQNVIYGDTAKWEYEFPNGRTYEIQASPYRDVDGTACQLTVFRDVTQPKRMRTNSEQLVKRD